MSRLATIVLALALAGPARAQVINGESTDDSAYAPRPPARWHAPEATGAVPDTEAREDARDQGIRSAPRRD